MIDLENINSEWITTVSKKNRKADKILVEKVIRALLLLEGLVKEKLSFVFKGGTALMLHFESTKRLSIDIDIIVKEKPDNLEYILENVMKKQGFRRKKIQKRVNDNKINKAHYKFFYHPLYKAGKEEEYVILDILYEKVYYRKLVQLNIRSSFAPASGSPLKVYLPSHEDLLGDKLTAFAPNTTGIPYFKNKVSMSMEIIKQLYDIGNLVDKTDDIETVKLTFKIFANTEYIEGLRIVKNEKYNMPFSFFNIVFIHHEISKSYELKEILAHEKVHIRGLHWFDLLMIELLTVIFWFNPFIWLFEHAIKQNHEYLADKGVLAQGHNAGRYQALLLNQLAGVQIIGITNNLNFAINSNRFTMMTKMKTPKIKKVKFAWSLPVLALLLFAFAEPKYKVNVVENAINQPISAEKITTAIIITRLNNLFFINKELQLPHR